MAAAWAASEAGGCRSLNIACTRYPSRSCRTSGRRDNCTPSAANACTTPRHLDSSGSSTLGSRRSCSTCRRPGSRLGCPSGTRCHTSCRHLRSSTRSSSWCTAHRRDARHSWRRAAPRPRAPAARPWSAQGGGLASRQRSGSYQKALPTLAVTDSQPTELEIPGTPYPWRVWWHFMT